MRGRGSLRTFAVLVLLAGCSPAAPEPTLAPDGPRREHWQLSHRVPTSKTVRLLQQSIGDYGESSLVGFVDHAGGAEVQCFVSISVPGWGGPVNKVGEQVPATVQGRPALRSGAGAEGDYVMWQRADRTWAETSCGDEGQQEHQDRLAELVTDEATSIRLPFDLAESSPSLVVHRVEQDLTSGATTVMAVARDGDGPESDLVLTYDVEQYHREGRAGDVGGFPAVLDDGPKNPGLCLTVQRHEVCVGASSSDTGPYPDRSAELPVMIALAERLRFPTDLEDRSSWPRAEDVLG